MRKTSVGSLEVSVVGMGCNNFGRALDAAGTGRVVGAALDLGVTFFDTADNYGDGRSEDYLAKALGKRRSEVVIATKFGMPVPQEDGSSGAKPEYVRRAVERSLRMLQTDWIDLYQLHLPDPTAPIGDTLEVLSELVESGRVREIGSSNLSASQMAEAAEVAGAGGWPPFTTTQVQYSLLHRTPEKDGTVAQCLAEGMGLLPYYPLANGLLTGKLHKGQDPTGRLQMERYQGFLTDANFAMVDRLRSFADERDLTEVQVALGWLLAQPVVPVVIPGATRTEHVRASAAAADWHPTTEDLAELDVVSPPEPTGDAPPTTS